MDEKEKWKQVGEFPVAVGLDGWMVFTALS
jgi:hypothetical protein